METLIELEPFDARDAREGDIVATLGTSRDRELAHDPAWRLVRIVRHAEGDPRPSYARYRRR